MSNTTSRSAPVSQKERVTSLDLIRGIAILGILPMNALTWGFSDFAGYSNVRAVGTEQPFDWFIGIASKLFIEQKMMALFSLLFGVGVVIFWERAGSKTAHPYWLSLWRFTLLFVIGTIHAWFWFGDVLTAYAISAPIVLAVHRRSPKVLMAVGVGLVVIGSLSAWLVQIGVNDGSYQIGEYWVPGGTPLLESELLTWFYADAILRSIGLMLIGVSLYRLHIVQGQRSQEMYKKMACWGLGVGLLVTCGGVAIHIVDSWSERTALVGHIPLGLGTIPMALGYIGLIVLWKNDVSKLQQRLQAAGRMAMTNYLSQTVLGLSTLFVLAQEVELTRTMIFVWILLIWALQLWWSPWWLQRFRFGPAEWLWRCGTYRSRQPFRRSTN
ncbi:MAG TPA: hypothetical protein DEB38_06225 [Acidimicrobiaceae bacterium]|nr:hypothetical protein [Acidimicrobiaceae bacterium]